MFPVDGPDAATDEYIFPSLPFTTEIGPPLFQM